MSIIKMPKITGIKIIPLIIFLFLVEWLQRDKLHGLELENTKFPRLFRWSFYYILLFMILYFRISTPKSGFIYVRF